MTKLTSATTHAQQPPPQSESTKLCEPSPLYLKYEPHIAKAKAIWGKRVKVEKRFDSFVFLPRKLQHWTWTLEAETLKFRVSKIPGNFCRFRLQKQNRAVENCVMWNADSIGLRVLVLSVPGTQSNSKTCEFWRYQQKHRTAPVWGCFLAPWKPGLQISFLSTQSHLL